MINAWNLSGLSGQSISCIFSLKSRKAKRLVCVLRHLLISWGYSPSLSLPWEFDRSQGKTTARLPRGGTLGYVPSSALLFFILLYLPAVWQRLTWGDMQDFCRHWADHGSSSLHASPMKTSPHSYARGEMSPQTASTVMSWRVVLTITMVNFGGAEGG